MKALILTTLTLIATSANASEQGRPEKILGYLPTKAGVIFQVTSGGCTNREDFRFEVARSDTTDIAELVMIRTRPDLCYPFIPTGERFKFSYEDLRIEPGERFIVRNENGVVLGWIWPDTRP